MPIKVDDTTLECVLFRHAMEDFIPPPGKYSGPGWGTTFHLRCARGCGTVRHVTIDSLGEVSTSHYEHDPAYLEKRREILLENDTGTLRLEHLKRHQSRLRQARKERVR